MILFQYLLKKSISVSITDKANENNVGILYSNLFQFVDIYSFISSITLSNSFID